jgi:hypothetical protein
VAELLFMSVRVAATIGCLGGFGAARLGSQGARYTCPQQAPPVALSHRCDAMRRMRHREESPADKPPSGTNWIHEIKHDGYRLMPDATPVGSPAGATTGRPATQCTVFYRPPSRALSTIGTMYQRQARRKSTASARMAPSVNDVTAVEVAT